MNDNIFENWIDVIGHEELYQISSIGRWRIKERVVSKGKRGQRIIKEKITTGYVVGEPGNDYKKVTLSKLGKPRPIQVHRLVAVHFIPNPLDLPYVNHKDGNRFNNRVENLEWVTTMENQCHSHLNRNFKSKYPGVGLRVVDNKWISRITVNKKRILLGAFDKEEDAHKARVVFEKENNINNKYSKL